MAGGYENEDQQAELERLRHEQERIAREREALRRQTEGPRPVRTGFAEDEEE